MIEKHYKVKAQKYYKVKVFIPDSDGGTTTYFGSYAETAQAAMESVAEENPDVTVIRASLSE